MTTKLKTTRKKAVASETVIQPGYIEIKAIPEKIAPTPIDSAGDVDLTDSEGEELRDFAYAGEHTLSLDIVTKWTLYCEEP